MHATPGPFGLDQSPLAAETFLRQAPILVSDFTPKRKRAHVAPSEHEARRLCCSRTGRPFRGYKHPGLTKSKPRGSWARMGLSGRINASPASRIAKVCNQPLVIRADQGPPGRSPGSQSQVQGLFRPETPEHPVILLAIPGSETLLPDFEGARPQPDLVSWQPLRSMAAQCLPTCCCNPLGSLDRFAGSAHSRCVNQVRQP